MHYEQHKNQSIIEYQIQESQPAGLAPSSVSSGGLYSALSQGSFSPELANSSQGEMSTFLF